MAFVTTITGDLQVQGAMTVSGAPTFGTGTLDNTHIKQSAKIESTKVRQVQTFSGSQLGNAVADTIPLGNLARAGTVTKVTVSIGAAASGGGTADVDFQLDGVSLLSGGTAIPLAATSANNKVTGTLKTDATVTYDPVTEQGRLTVVISNITATAPSDLGFTLEFETNE